MITYAQLVYETHKSKQVTNNLAKAHRLEEIFPLIELSSAVMDCYGATKV